MPKKKIIIYSVSLLLIVALAATIHLLTRERETNAHNPEFAEYITAHTYGTISKADAVELHLTSNTSEALSDKELKLESLFKFNPSLEGEVVAEGNVIKFVPEDNFPSGKSFYAEFNLGKIVDVKSKLKTFTFKFDVKEQDIDYEITEQVTIDRKELKYQQVKGVVYTSDKETSEAVAKVLKADQNGEDLAVNWTTDAEGTQHFFTIDSIEREEKDRTLEIEINGRDIGVSYRNTEKIEIPGFQNFELISSKVYNEPEQVLQLQFSDPIMPNQDLNGIINIEGLSNIKYVIENNTVSVYTPQRIAEVKTVTIDGRIKNLLGYPLDENMSFSVAFEELEPEINFLDNGNILPSTSKGMLVPFEAVNLKAVDVAVIRIHENNVLQFLQGNSLNDSYQLRYVGKPIAMQTVRLDEFGIQDLGIKNRFFLDLNKLIETEPGAIYRVMFRVKKDYSLYSCVANSAEDNEIEGLVLDGDVDWDTYEDIFGYNYYYWRDRDDPCEEAFYDEMKKGKNILASNLGIIAKKGKDHSVNVFVTDLLSSEPKENVNVEIFDFQKQLLGEAVTDKDGKVSFADQKDVYFAVAKIGTESGYLKLNEGEALSLSKFDVSGKTVSKGVKGFIYEERGVRRPGDSVFVTFVLHEQDGKLPKEHPLKFQLTDPNGKLVETQTQNINSTGFYTFRTLTESNAPTGNYLFTAEAGALNFQKIIKIETVKPNRLDIKLNFDDEYLSENQGIEAELIAKWLHGAPADNMRAQVDLTLRPQTTKFPKYSDYVFDDPIKTFSSDTETIYDGITDSEGKTTIRKRLHAKENAPGMLNANFTMRVYEKGGNFSISKTSKPYSPYTSYIGISLPEISESKYYYDSGKDVKCDFVIVDPEGKPVKDNRRVELYFYKLSWRWWWNASQNQISSYSFRNSARLIKKETFSTQNGKVSWNVANGDNDWGRYLVWAKDLESGHSTGQTLYFDWPYRSRGDENKEGASMLVFSTDKEKYKVGDRAKVSFPSGSKGNALVSIENGTKVIETFWTKTKKGTTDFTFDVTEEMHPNAYIHITLLQEHLQTANDLPLRMYGVMPLAVEDENTVLNPVIDMPDELRSEQTVRIDVSEKDNKAMTYTLAVVDEGLLGLTNFKTPNPADEFFAKEAIGVKSWDLFNLVIGAQKGKPERLLTIGGDMDVDREQKEKAKRFKPVVSFLGPFTVRGGKNTHYVKIPKYIGAVRTMVIAGDKDNAYGSAEKTTPVIKPLMLVSTLPRVLRPKEKIKLPVTLFAMKDHIKSADVTVKTDNYIKVLGERSKKVNFDKPGDKTIDFDLEVLSQVGVTKVEITAVSGNEKSSEIIELDVENPNPVVSITQSNLTEKSKAWDKSFDLVGIEGTNTALLEISSIPSVNLEARLNYLIRYPHGCIEQTTSSVFPQLYLSKVTELTQKQKTETEVNIKEAIKRFNNFQLPNGGFAYWQGGRDASLWGTNYAGHFLVEAEKAGYPVSPNMMKRWREFQKEEARNWTDNGPSSQLMQAYRLYTLALAGQADRSAMNRLNSKELSTAAKWRLAAAYHIAGKRRTAAELTQNLPLQVSSYRELYYTYGSDLRDEAMILETLTLTGEKDKAFRLLQSIAKSLSSDSYFSTQTTAYALIAVSGYIDEYVKSENMEFTYTLNGKTKTVNSVNPIVRENLSVAKLSNNNLKFQNKSGGVLYASLILEGKPDIGSSVNTTNDLAMTVKYELPDGTPIKPDNIQQGTDFIALVTINNPGSRGHYKEMALSQIFPSGWEIINTRLYEYSDSDETDNSKYRDIRDDRVYTYFDLSKGKSKTFRVMLNASYAGEFWLPPVNCEAMYDHTISASKGGKFVKVVQL
jgi:uncharacterized protein YfaS (alpha-2-macroglobulin family)